MIKTVTRMIPPLFFGGVIGFYLHGIVSPVKPGEAAPVMIEQTQKAGTPMAIPRSIQPGEPPSTLTKNSVAEVQAALEHLTDISDLNERARTRNELLRRWAELDGRGAFAYVSAMDEGEIKEQGMAAVAGVLAHSDPQFLAGQALALPSSRSSRELTENLAKSWAQTDATSALTWAMQLPEGVGKNDALAIIRAQLGQQNPEEASRQISLLPTGDPRNTQISNLAAQWGANDPAKAVEWANTLSGNEKTLAMSQLTSAWAQHDPMAAGTFVAQLPLGEMQNQAAMSVVTSWARQNPATAAAWVLQFPDNTVQEQGIREVLGAWVNTDSQSALNWAKALPDGRTRDAALASLVENVGYWSPDKAAGMTGLIEDPAKRDQSMETAMRFWSETDPTSARNWLAGLNASEDLKVRLQSFLPAKN